MPSVIVLFAPTATEYRSYITRAPACSTGVVRRLLCHSSVPPRTIAVRPSKRSSAHPPRCYVYSTVGSRVSEKIQAEYYSTRARANRSRQASEFVFLLPFLLHALTIDVTYSPTPNTLLSNTWVQRQKNDSHTSREKIFSHVLPIYFSPSPFLRSSRFLVFRWVLNTFRLTLG